MAKAFPAHGRYKLYCEDRLMISEVIGPWNLEFIREWSMASIPYCEQMREGGAWIAYAKISGSMLATPEAMDALRKVIVNSRDLYGCIGHVLVAAPDVAGRGIVEFAFERSYGDITKTGFFDDDASAKAWAKALLAQHHPQPSRSTV